MTGRVSTIKHRRFRFDYVALHIISWGWKCHIYWYIPGTRYTAVVPGIKSTNRQAAALATRHEAPANLRAWHVITMVYDVVYKKNDILIVRGLSAT